MPSTTELTVTQKLAGSLNKTTDWLTTRIKNIDIFDEHFGEEAKTNPFYTLGSIFYLVWFIVMATGLLLIMWYVPTKAAAFDSILAIQHQIPLGNIMRGMHKYGADAMIIAATIRMFRMFICADYKPSRELNIAIGLVTLLLSMYSGLTGYLLIWNQRAFWATKVFATFPTYMDSFPVMGDFYQPLVKSLHLGWNTAEFLLGAGGAITQETITRFFSLHLAFSLIPLIFVELYFYHTGFRRVNLSWLKRFVVTMMLVVVAIILPAALGHRSNPDVTPLPILSDWYFLGLYQMYKYLEPVVATEITILIPLTVVIIPFLDVAITGPEKDWKKRPFVFWTTVMGFLNWIIFSWLIVVNIANIHSDPPWWRTFLWGLPNVGMLLQVMVFLRNKNVQERVKQAGGCIVMGAFCLVQSFLAGIFYFMAQTEMFFDPLRQSFMYWMTRPFLGNAQATEELMRQALNTPGRGVPTYACGDFWVFNFHNLLALDSPIKNRDVLEKIADAAKQTSPVDFIYQLVPTFQIDFQKIADAVHANGTMKTITDFAPILADPVKYGLEVKNIPDQTYHTAMDFMIANGWVMDYVNFCDRMNHAQMGYLSATPNPIVNPYPMVVPDVDWIWMLLAPFTAAVCFWAHFKLKASAPAAAAPTTPAKS